MPTTWGGCRPSSCPQGERGTRGWWTERAGQAPRRPLTLLPRSLLQLFPSGGSIRGCVKGIKALGKYVDLKRLNTSGISFGCTADLLVSAFPEVGSLAPGPAGTQQTLHRWDAR